MQDKNADEDFKRVGYKNSFSTWVLLTGSIISLILAVLIFISKSDNFITYALIFLLLAVVFFVSFVIEKKRPDVVVYLSDNSVKILKGFKYKVISFDDIDYVDYKLDVFKKTQSILFGAGDLIIESNNQKFVVRNIENVRNCYEKITEAQKNYEAAEWNS